MHEETGGHGAATFYGFLAKLHPRLRATRGFGRALLVIERPEIIPEDRPLGRRLAHLAFWSGLDPDAFGKFFDFAYLVDLLPRDDVSEPWPKAEAAARGDMIVRTVICPNCWSTTPPIDRDIVVLGRRAWSALGLAPVPYFCNGLIGRRGEGGAQLPNASPRFLLLPDPAHPSSVLDVPECEETAIKLLQLLVKYHRARSPNPSESAPRS